MQRHGARAHTHTHRHTGFGTWERRIRFTHSEHVCASGLCFNIYYMLYNDINIAINEIHHPPRMAGRSDERWSRVSVISFIIVFVKLFLALSSLCQWPMVRRAKINRFPSPSSWRRTRHPIDRNRTGPARRDATRSYRMRFAFESVVCTRTHAHWPRYSARNNIRCDSISTQLWQTNRGRFCRDGFVSFEDAPKRVVVRNTTDVVHDVDRPGN